MSSIYLQCVIVMHEGYIPIIFYLLMTLSDTFFGYVYAVFGNFLYPSGYFGFAAFPKMFLTIGCYFLYDDRLWEILGYSALSLFIHTFSGFAYEDLLLSCHEEKIHEFSTFDFYVLMYLDLPIVVMKGWSSGKDHILDFHDKLFKVKQYNKVPVEEEKKDDKEKKEWIVQLYLIKFPNFQLEIK